MSGYTKQDWNNGTIYRIFVKSKENANFSPVIDVPIDIAQSELNGKVFIGVENFVLERELINTNFGTNPSRMHSQDQTLIDAWSLQRYVQLRSVQLPPDIDFTTSAVTDSGSNSQIFARLPLKTDYFRESGTLHPLQPRVTGDYDLQKSGILYEMSNNPNAISNGRMRIELLNETGQQWPISAGDDSCPIRAFTFTLVIYKPRNTYN